SCPAMRRTWAMAGKQNAAAAETGIATTGASSASAPPGRFAESKSTRVTSRATHQARAASKQASIACTGANCSRGRRSNRTPVTRSRIRFTPSPTSLTCDSTSFQTEEWAAFGCTVGRGPERPRYDRRAGLSGPPPMHLEELNGLDEPNAAREFVRCCGSPAWAAEMASERPFAGPESRAQTSDTIWASLDRTDWLEAFAAHPRIGDATAAPPATPSGPPRGVSESGSAENVGGVAGMPWATREQS